MAANTIDHAFTATLPDAVAGSSRASGALRGLRRSFPLPSLPPLAVLLCLCMLTLGACGDTIQDQPISRGALEPLVLQDRYPVYWLGGIFHGLEITEAVHDPSDAYAIHYGDCLEGGQYTCVTPLTIVTSPDNSFVPGDGSLRRTVSLRGVRALLAQRETTVEIPTGRVVVSIYAERRALALAAAQTMVPINEGGVPGAPLPAALPDTGFANQPLASQKPVGVHLPGAFAAPRSGAPIP